MEIAEKDLHDIIASTVEATIGRMSATDWADRQKAMQADAFKSTEKLLYAYQSLKDHIEDEAEYMSMIDKRTSTSVVRYSKTKSERPDEEQLLSDRRLSYMRSKADLDRLERALEHVRKSKWYDLVCLRYFSRKEDDSLYTYEEIAEILSLKEGFGDNLTEKTVRIHKNKIVSEIAVYLFGTDAV